MHRAGVKRISKRSNDKIRYIIEQYMKKIIGIMVIFVQNDNRKTIKIGDLRSALETMGMYLAVDLNCRSNKQSFQSCVSGKKSGPTKKSSIKGTEERRSHRYKPGTKTLRSIKYQQKNSECLAIPKAIFENITRTLTDELRFSKGVFILFQIVVEKYIIELCEKSYLCTLHSNRDTIKPEDIDLILRIV